MLQKGTRLNSREVSEQFHAQLRKKTLVQGRSGRETATLRGAPYVNLLKSPLPAYRNQMHVVRAPRT